MWSFLKKWFGREEPKKALPSREVIGLKYEDRPLLRKDDLDRLNSSHLELKNLIDEVKNRAAELNQALTDELERTKRKVRIFMDSTFDAVLILNYEGTVIEVNSRAEKLFQQPAEELIGRTVESFQSTILVLGQQLATEAQSYIEYRKRMSDRFPDVADIYDRFVEYSAILRHIHHIECRSRVVEGLKLDVRLDIFNLDASNPINVVYLVVCKDMTQVHNSMNRIETLNQLQRGILQSVPNPIFYKNADSLFLGANHAFHGVFGTTNSTFALFRNEDLFEASTCIVLDDIEARLRTIDSSDVLVERIVMRTRDSSISEEGMIYCTSLRSSEGEYNGMIGTFVNFKLDTVDNLDLVTAIPSPAYIINEDGVFLSCNERFAQLVGIPVESIIGRTVSTLYDVPPNVTLGDLFEALLPKSDVFEGHCYNQRTGLTVNIVTYRKPFNSDTATGHLCVVLDVTEIKNIQRIHQHIFESTPIPMYMKDSALRFVQVNQPYADWLGLPKHKILDRTLYELKGLYDNGIDISGDQKSFYLANQVLIEAIGIDIARYDAQISGFAEGQVQTFELELPHFGKLALVSALMYRIPVFKDGAFDGIIGSVVDVSHFKDFRQSFANTLQVPTVVVDSNNLIREFNLQYATMLKTDPDYLIGQPFQPLPGAVIENANVASITSTKEVELDGVKYIRYSARTQNGLTAHMYFVVDA